MPKILNQKQTKHGVYVGRTFYVMHYGNPFTHRPGTRATVIVESRDAAIIAYADWLNGTKYQDIEPWRRQWILDNVYKLEGKDLRCWCAPKRCHAEVLIKLANIHPDEYCDIDLECDLGDC